MTEGVRFDPPIPATPIPPWCQTHSTYHEPCEDVAALRARLRLEEDGHQDIVDENAALRAHLAGLREAVLAHAGAVESYLAPTPSSGGNGGWFPTKELGDTFVSMRALVLASEGRP
jgi:hypothetical protein